MIAKPKKLLRGQLLVLDIKEGMVKCATVCVKSVVILKHDSFTGYQFFNQHIEPNAYVIYE